MKTRILFVDDEANVLAGLRRMLRGQRKVWEMHFANGGAEALEILAEHPFDVVVSDMRMPGIDGAELLNRVSELYPSTVRLVLSGQSEHEKIFRAIGPAHQFMSKPCEPHVLVSTIERACGLQSRLCNSTLGKLTSQLTDLPSLPNTYRELVAELESDAASLKRVSDKIGSDLGMTAKVLQLVNSSFFGLPQRVESPHHAVSLLGLDIIRPLVLSASAFSQFEEPNVEGFSLEELVNHSVAVATTAKRIAEDHTKDSGAVNDTFIAALMHDVGKLVLATKLPEQWTEAIVLANAKGLALCEAESQVLGASHAEVGGYLLGLWGLPNPIVEAVTFHHRPSEAPDATFLPLTAVHVANVVQHSRCPSDNFGMSQGFDERYMLDAGFSTDVADWEANALAIPTVSEA